MRRGNRLLLSRSVPAIMLADAALVDEVGRPRNPEKG